MTIAEVNADRSPRGHPHHAGKNHAQRAQARRPREPRNRHPRPHRHSLPEQFRSPKAHSDGGRPGAALIADPADRLHASGISLAKLRELGFA